MTLSDNLRLGDRLMISPSWTCGERGTPAPAQPAFVTYIHPAGRYCTVRYADGLTDTVQLASADRVLHEAEDSVRTYTRRSPIRNLRVRQALDELRVTQSSVARRMGVSRRDLSARLRQELPTAAQDEIIRAAQAAAKEQKTKKAPRAAGTAQGQEQSVLENPLLRL